jgi:hypothetical protein
MKQEDRYWVMKNLQKVYIEEGLKRKEELSNKEKSIDYELEEILAGLTITDNFDEDRYYNLLWEKSLDLK